MLQDVLWMSCGSYKNSLRWLCGPKEASQYQDEPAAPPAKCPETFPAPESFWPSDASKFTPADDPAILSHGNPSPLHAPSRLLAICPNVPNQIPFPLYGWIVGPSVFPSGVPDPPRAKKFFLAAMQLLADHACSPDRAEAVPVRHPGSLRIHAVRSASRSSGLSTPRRHEVYGPDLDLQSRANALFTDQPFFPPTPGLRRSSREERAASSGAASPNSSTGKRKRKLLLLTAISASPFDADVLCRLSNTNA